MTGVSFCVSSVVSRAHPRVAFSRVKGSKGGHSSCDPQGHLLRNRFHQEHGGGRCIDTILAERIQFTTAVRGICICICLVSTTHHSP